MRQSTVADGSQGKSPTEDGGGRSDHCPVDPKREGPDTARRFANERRAGDDHESVSVDPADLLSVLEDEYARMILNSVSDEPRPARELVAECDASRATVYRRLDRLEKQGLVTSGMDVNSSGHHRKVFEATLDEATISLSGEGVRVEVTVESPEVLADAPRGRNAVVDADD